MNTPLTRWIALGLLLISVVVVLRAPILDRAVIDWDESVYLLMARSLIDGNLPYVEIWGHKQPFLYVLLTLSFVVPDPIVGMRLVACLGVAVTALFLALMLRRFVGGWLFPGLAAMLYGLATMAPGGLATNTEVLYSPFLAAAFYVLVFAPNQDNAGKGEVRFRFGLAGFLSGLALQIKLIVAFDVLALAVVSLVLWWPRDKTSSDVVRRFVLHGLCFCLGLLAPVLLTVFVFWWRGSLDDYLFANFEFNLAYTDLAVDRWALVRASVVRQATQGSLAVFALALVGGIWLLWNERRRDRAATFLIFVGIVWMLAAIASVFVAAKFYDHHLLQILPPSVFLATAVIATMFKQQARSVRAVAVVIAVFLIGVQAVQARRNTDLVISTPDTPRQVGNYLGDQIEAGELIYVANSQPIIYLLAGAQSPTRFVQPAWVIRPEFRQRLGLDLDEFLEEVFEQGPSFVVMERDHPWLPDGPFVNLVVDRYLKDRYRPVARFGAVVVFESM